MGNRRKSVQDRIAQSYRNAGARWLEAFKAAPRRAPNGELRRNEGRQNWPYGPTAKHSHTGVLALKRARERTRRDYTQPNYDALTRDDLRALAKQRGLTGYGKMSKPQLIEVLSR